ncbi:hypothetical protein ACS0TY_010593 [Phlomoides rotata]
MFGTVSEEKEVKVPASEAWELYRSLELVKIVLEALPTIVAKYDVVEGDGAPGTLVHVFFVPGMMGGLTSYKEKFTVVDDEKRVKEVEVVEGGYLDQGFVLYRVRFEVIEIEGNEECVTRATIEYEVKDEVAENAAFVSILPYVAIMQFAADHLHQNHNTK